MNKKEVKKAVKKALRSNSETALVEFKDGRKGFPKSVRYSVSSFGHKPGGGIIAFGVVEDGGDFKVVKNDNFDYLQEKFGDLMNNEMSSVIRPDYYFLELEGTEVLAVYVPECPSQNKPYYYEPTGVSDGSYIRDGNTDRKMTDSEMKEFVVNARKYKYDTNKAEGVSLDELSKEKILDLLIKTGRRTEREASIEDVDFELMKNLGIADEFDQQKAPTIGGFLIFAKDDPQKKISFSRYEVRCVRYKGSNPATDIIDRRDIKGTLDEQIDEVQNFILRNIRQGSEIEGTQRVDKYEYPQKAIREVVANAVIHRDYKITETYTQVNIFEDRIEVFNPGCLPPGVTVENIKDAQASRNEMIAARLKDLDYLEEYGRGMNIIFSKMDEWGLLDPIFKNTANSFKVILMGEKLSKLNDKQIKIWNYLVDNKKVTAKECEDILESASRKSINYNLKKMQEMELIHSEGKSINTYYEPNF